MEADAPGEHVRRAELFVPLPQPFPVEASRCTRTARQRGVLGTQLRRGAFQRRDTQAAISRSASAGVHLDELLFAIRRACGRAAPTSRAQKGCVPAKRHKLSETARTNSGARTGDVRPDVPRDGAQADAAVTHALALCRTNTDTLHSTRGPTSIGRRADISLSSNYQSRGGSHSLFKQTIPGE